MLECELENSSSSSSSSWETTISLLIRTRFFSRSSLGFGLLVPEFLLDLVGVLSFDIVFTGFACFGDGLLIDWDKAYLNILSGDVDLVLAS